MKSIAMAINSTIVATALAATNSENAQKAVAMLAEISSGGVNNSEVRLTAEQKLEMNAQAFHLRVMIAQYDAAAKNVLGQDATNGVPDYNGGFDMVADGVGDSFAEVYRCAEIGLAEKAAMDRETQNVNNFLPAGKAMMRGMGGKALPAGMIAKLVQAAANAKIDAIRKLSSRSSGLDIHRAVTELRDNLVRAMSASGAEEAAGGPDEKQAFRNFLAALMMHRCGEKTLHAMDGAFAGETAGKMLALYSAIANGEFNEGLDRQSAIRLEDQAGSHMTHLTVLKDALGRALGQPGGAGLVPYDGDLNADEISGPAIFDDLVNLSASNG